MIEAIKNKTSEAINILNKFRQEGLICEPYSVAWLSARKPDSFFFNSDDVCSDLQDFSDEGDYDNDMDWSDEEQLKNWCEKAKINVLPKLDYIDSLIMIRIPDDQEFRDLLIKLYPKLASLYKDNLPEPDFLMLDMSDNQAIAMGLSNGNKFFTYDVEKQKFVNADDLTDYPNIDDFCLMNIDQHEWAYDFASALSELGSYMSEYDHLPYSLDQLTELLEQSSDSDELLFIEGDSEGMTKAEIQETIEQYETVEKNIDEQMKIINVFFPDLDWTEINKRDYFKSWTA